MASEPQPVPLPEPVQKEVCSRCGTSFREEAVFCEICGAVRPSLSESPPTRPEDWRTWALRSPKYEYAVPQRNWRSIVRTICSAVMITVAISLIAGLVTLVYGIGMVLPEIGDYSYPLFIIIPVLVTLVELSGVGLEIYYLLLVVAIVVSAVALAIRSYGGFKNELMGKGISREHSPFFEMCGLLFATLFFNTVIVYLLMAFGYEPEGPSEEMDVWEMLFVLANASVWEEIITRVLLIGVPLMIYGLMTHNLKRKPLSYVLGGGFTLGAPEVLLIVVSSLMFGFAHYEGGWGAWKIAPSAVAGFALGYLFLKYGIYASIMLHFTIDYMSMPMEVFDSFAVEILTVLAVVLWLFIGVGFFIYYLVRTAEFFTERKYFEPKPTVVAVTGFYPGPYAPGQYQGVYQGPPSPPQYQGSPGFYSPPPPPQQTPAPQQQAWRGGAYVCPSCGHTEARWVDGRFQCLRCGNLS